MFRLALTLATPQENLALDEALLDWSERAGEQVETLRLWESPVPFVVVGRSSRVEQEVNQTACEQHGLPILRRSSGGAAVVVGPGCLMYSVVMSYSLGSELRDVSRAHASILRRLAEGLRPLSTGIVCAGTSDLVLDAPPHAKKFSGNSLRAKRTHFLYHGTLLYDFQLPLIAACLNMPARQPNYRRARPHAEFVCNLPAPREQLIAAVDRAFPTDAPLSEWPRELVKQLVAERFSRDDWNLSFG